MLYKVTSDTETSDALLISPDFRTRFLSHLGSGVIVYAGVKKRYVKVRVIPDKNIKTITISSNTLAELSIPANLHYQIRQESQGIRFGPVIGLLETKRKSNLKNNLNTYLPRYTGLYSQTHGLLCAFSMEGIDFRTNTVEGYYFNPAEKTEGKWVEGVFPLPDAIFREVLINDVKRLQKITNNRFFNSYRLSKMEYWSYASKSDSVRRHLPETRRLSSMNVLAQMLDRYNAVVLKRVLGSQGIGFIMVKKTDSSYSVQKKWDKSPTIFTDRDKMLRYIARITRKHSYLVQRAVDLLRFDERYTDFRVIMQKDFSCRWKCAGIVASMGAVKGNCSNYPKNQSVFLSFEEFFSRYLGLSSAAIAQKKKKVIQTCIKACEVLDRPGLNYGDIAFDLAIDTSLSIWILEFNTLHLQEILLYIGDEDAYNALHLNRIGYLTAMSGFNLLLPSGKRGGS